MSYITERWNVGYPFVDALPRLSTVGCPSLYRSQHSLLPDVALDSSDRQQALRRWLGADQGFLLSH